jgi:hypothetical protein
VNFSNDDRNLFVFDVESDLFIDVKDMNELKTSDVDVEASIASENETRATCNFSLIRRSCERLSNSTSVVFDSKSLNMRIDSFSKKFIISSSMMYVKMSSSFIEK